MLSHQKTLWNDEGTKLSWPWPLQTGLHHGSLGHELSGETLKAMYSSRRVSFERAVGSAWSSWCKKEVLEWWLQQAGCRQKSPEDILLEMTGRHFQLGGRWEEEGKSLQRNGSFYRHRGPSTKKNLFFCSFVYNHKPRIRELGTALRSPLKCLVIISVSTGKTD